MNLKISQDFTEMPGARNRDDGDWSGQEFREDILEKKFEAALKAKEKLTIDFDGTYGYATSFLEEAFGGLARKYGYSKVIDALELISEDEPGLVDEIRGYIQNAEKHRK